MAAAKTFVTIDVQEDYMAAHLFGELDHHSVQPIREEIDRMAAQNHPKELVLDFGGVTFMDSSGIAVIIRVSRRMKTLGGRAWIENPAKQPRRVIDAAGIDRLVPVALGK